MSIEMNSPFTTLAAFNAVSLNFSSIIIGEGVPPRATLALHSFGGIFLA